MGTQRGFHRDQITPNFFEKRPQLQKAVVGMLTGGNGFCTGEILLPIVKSASGLTARSIQHTVARQAHHKHESDLHDKYGNIILLGGVVFCASIWTYVVTQTGIEWNFSPVGQVTPKVWRAKWRCLHPCLGNVGSNHELV
uniref:cytochrome c oxidase subunit 7B, mitochondrial-like n=1 Tax=Euleptes europaea TaxID=460621 RepID=UPI002541648E|nr:cytochrome c oxidase subunit 7B, mitochondrial-like [Euleptes europaea]